MQMQTDHRLSLTELIKVMMVMMMMVLVVVSAIRLGSYRFRLDEFDSIPEITVWVDLIMCTSVLIN